MEHKNFDIQQKRYSDSDYIAGLKCGDSTIVQSFFYTLCSYTISDIQWSLMQGRITYDELVNELYIYLSINNWHKLDTFEGKNNCTLKSWMVRLTWRFFMERRSHLLHDVSHYEFESMNGINESEDFLKLEISMDVESTFNRMTNKRYVQVLKWMLIDGFDADEVSEFLKTPISNVYNLKHRAIVQFVETYNC